MYATLLLVVGVFVGGVATYWIPFALDTLTADSTVRTQKDAEKKADFKDPPFTVELRYETFGPGFANPWHMVLDRPLTQAEQKQLTSVRGEGTEYFAQVHKILAPLGARVITYAGYALGRDNTARSFFLNLHSDRNAELSIVDMKSKIDSCSPSTAQTVVTQPPAGTVEVPGVLWDLDSGNDNPIAVDENDEHKGEPYFWYNQIDLGDGAAPGALRVQSAVGRESCRWHIEARYTDTAGEHGPVRIPAEGEIFTEALPSHPAQRFTLSEMYADGENAWRCSGKVVTSNCRGPA
ncbi:hypothetical protein ACFY8O_17095 [Streptomyces argenteolus]|uniref:Uncharacterized protein n=1 Tax=Streptomyces argenteolus TaxID=67274 RepID=A0ABW6X6I9_9ACTN